MDSRLKAFLLWTTTGVGALVVVGALIWLLIWTIEARRPVEVSVPATPAPELKRAPTARVAIKAPVKVYTGSTKAKLKLPADAQANQFENVLAATTVKGNDRPQTVTTTINTETGESRSFVKQDPLPWFAIETRGEARLALGYRYDGSGLPKQIVRLGINYDAIRVKALTAGITGTVDSDGRTFIGIGVAYRW